MNASKTLLQAIAVTAELTGTQLSEPAVRAMANHLAQFPESQILPALYRCQAELHQRGFTIESVISRIDDGRPGPEESWAMIPRDEATTLVWTQEMQQAWGVARPLLLEGEPIPARMAYRECYEKLLRDARASGIPVKWQVSIGTDKGGIEAVLMEAVRLGRITHEHALRFLPYMEKASQIAIEVAKKLLGKRPPPQSPNNSA